MGTPRALGRLGALFVAASLTWRAAAAPVPDLPITVHEWGTFTALQDDDGTALGAINADDEPVPSFVCRTGIVSVLPSGSSLTPRLASGFSKGVATCHPGVTMRLETPVIYFYPPEGKEHAVLNLKVTFRGGWLTEFYPFARADAPDLLNAQSYYPPLTADTSGSLTWNGLALHATGALTETDDPVWTAPREVSRAAVVQVPSPTNSADDAAARPEKFVFYRGLGHLDSPLRVAHDPRSDRLSIYPALAEIDGRLEGKGKADLRIPSAWLIEVRPGDGQCAFRSIAGEMDLHGSVNEPLTTLPASFSANDFGPRRLQELRDAMQTALVAAGLFPDEAAAMLKTWELSYFEHPGRRLFYIVPRVWTDAVLPMAITGANTALTRVMIGRIELITSAQRERLARLAAGPCPDLTALTRAYADAARDFANHRPPGLPWINPSFAAAGVAVPALYQDYLDLGRFRDALVLREEQRHPTPALAAFITGNELQLR